MVSIIKLCQTITISLSFSVPFMADTIGTWKVGGMDEWNDTRNRH